MSVVCHVATIESDHEAIVEGANLPEGTTFDSLADYLSIPVGELLDAVHAERNAMFAQALYARLRSEVVVPPGSGLTPVVEEPFEHDMFGPVVQRHELPPAEGLTAEQIRAKLRLVADHGPVDPRQWPVPPELLAIPFATGEVGDDHELRRDHVHKLYGLGPRRDRCVELRELVMPLIEIEDLRAKVEALDKEIEAHERMMRRQGRFPPLVMRTLMVAQLQERHWWSEQRKPQDRRLDDLDDGELEARRAAAGNLADALDDLHVAAVRNLLEPRELRLAADAVLELLDPGRSENSALHELIAVVGSLPELIEQRLRDDLLALLERAVWGIARSPRADKLLKLHALDMLEAACERAPRGFRETLAKAEDAELGREIRDDWREAITLARQELKAPPPGTSPLATIGKLAKTYRNANKIVSGALSEGLLTRFLAALHAQAQAPESPTGVERKLAVLLLRFMGSHSSQRRGRPQSLLIGSHVTYAQVLTIVSRVSDPVHADPGALAEELREVGKKLKGLGIGDVANSRVGASLNFIVATATMLLAANADPTNALAYQANVMYGVAGLASHLPRAAAVYLLARHGASAPSGDFFKLAVGSAKAFAGFASYFGFVASIAMMNDEGRRAQGYVYADTLAAFSHAAGVATWVFEFFQVARYAAIGGIAGGLLGLASLAVAIAIETLRPGPQKFIEGYLDAVRDAHVVARAPFEMERVDKAFKAAAEAGAFAAFREFVGKPDDDPARMSPTFHGCLRLGFSGEEISALFDTTPAFVFASLPISEWKAPVRDEPRQ
jgi:hypothetical protein